MDCFDRFHRMIIHTFQIHYFLSNGTIYGIGSKQIFYRFGSTGDSVLNFLSVTLYCFELLVSCYLQQLGQQRVCLFSITVSVLHSRNS